VKRKRVGRRINQVAISRAKSKEVTQQSKTATAAEAEELKVDSSQAVTLTDQTALVEPSRDGLVVGAPVVRRAVKSPEKIAPVAEPAVPVVDKEGTLHKPLAKPGEKIERVNKTARPGNVLLNVKSRACTSVLPTRLQVR